MADGKNNKSSSSSENEEEEKKTKGDENLGKRRVEDYDYSSGIESDNDVDLLVE